MFKGGDGETGFDGGWEVPENSGSGSKGERLAEVQERGMGGWKYVSGESTRGGVRGWLDCVGGDVNKSIYNLQKEEQLHLFTSR